MHLEELQIILGQKTQKYLYPCIKDLILNGLSLSRFSESESRPTRQDITQYVVSWFRHTGLSADDCREWMLGYCVEVLSPLSASSKSRIKHSTKSNIKYIYKSEVDFNCECENNTFRASCDKGCPVYGQMIIRCRQKALLQKKEDESFQLQRYDSAPPLLSVKEANRDQFEKAMSVVKTNLEKKVSKADIVKFLNENGFKTRTGKAWTASVLYLEIKKGQDKK